MKKLIITSLALSILVGCEQTPDLKGSYSGTMLDQQSEQLVKLVLEQEDEDLYVVHVQNEKKEEPLTVHLKLLGKKSLGILVSSLGPDYMTLKKKNDCFETPYKGNGLVQVCTSEKAITLLVSDEKQEPLIKVVAVKSDSSNMIKEGPSKDFTLTSAVKLGTKMSPETRIELQNVLMTKYQAQASHRMLIPHLSLGGISSGATSLFSFNLPALVMSGVSAIQDFLPFLLPNKWAEAGASTEAREAEREGLIAARANSANTIEGLAYVFDRDNQVLSLFQKTLLRAQDIQYQIQERERMGQLPKGSSDNIRAVVNGIKQNVLVTTLLVAKDKAALAQAMGLYDPMGVNSLVIDVETDPIGTAGEMKEEELIPVALANSVELRQMDHFIQMAKLERKAVKWSWLDPSDSSAPLGFNLGPQLEASLANVHMMEVKKFSVASLIEQKVINAVLERNNALNSYKLANEALNIQTRILERSTEGIRFGSDSDMFNLMTAFKNYLEAGLAKINLVASFRIARANLDRLTFKGLYEDPQSPFHTDGREE